MRCLKMANRNLEGLMAKRKAVAPWLVTVICEEVRTESRGQFPDETVARTHVLRFTEAHYMREETVRELAEAAGKRWANAGGDRWYYARSGAHPDRACGLLSVTVERKGKHKPAYRTPHRKVPANVDLMAENYARWLAARDGVVIDPSWAAHLVSGWVITGTRVTKWGAKVAKGTSRTRAVCFGIRRGRNWRGDYGQFEEHVRIEIPNWDWVPAEPVEETLDSPALVPETMRELVAA